MRKLLLIASAVTSEDTGATETQATDESSGETADLPLCSEAAPPCRNPDGSFVEP